ncbi:hypothetical protein F4808DRAFT_109559 [Astrocystis sublimbata]|nr:hypothetical protein F4808DRAFT_109559 [Astrocystis sublimbata]
MKVATSMPVGAATTGGSRHGPQMLNDLNPSSALPLARRLLSLFFLQASLFASGLLQVAGIITIRAWVAASTIACISAQLLRQAAWYLWDGAHGRRLRKKIEFEFFVLILGGGGYDLCLVLFWPGWGILGVAALVYAAWCAS